MEHREIRMHGKTRSRMRNRWWKYFVAGLLLAALLPPVMGTGKQDLKAQIEELKRRLEKLEKERTPQPEAVPKSEKQASSDEELAEVRRQVDILAIEVERLRSGEPEIEITDDQARSKGLGPAAATIYRKQQGVSIAGYGEMLYNNFSVHNESGDPVSKTSELDFLRAILYAGYRFNDRFVFNSEIEIEHGSTSLGGSTSVEFAYLDFLVNDHLTLRGGLLLLPMGLVNELHEPTVFVGANRPETERRIMPSTWRENGFGFVGSAGMVDYRVYVVNGLLGSKFSSNGLRGGRQKGYKAKASHMAVVARVDLNPTPGVFFGGSIYNGGSGQGLTLDGQDLDLGTRIGELHAQIRMEGFDLRGLYARASLDDVAELNQALGYTGMNSVGETQQGGYLQFGYNLLSRVREDVRLMPYYRAETLDTQAQVPAGYLRNPARDRSFHTLGLELKPISNIVVKADYQWNRNRAKTGLDQFNLAMGYSGHSSPPDRRLESRRSGGHKGDWKLPRSVPPDGFRASRRDSTSPVQASTHVVKIMWSTNETAEPPLPVSDRLHPVINRSLTTGLPGHIQGRGQSLQFDNSFFPDLSRCEVDNLIVSGKVRG